MIERLSIRNYAIIDNLELEFGGGFHVFTGETGAGKSIVVGAIDLLLGAKADAGVIRTGEERATVEAEFSVTDVDTARRFRELGIEDPSSLIIRREIVQGGKSRVFINGFQEPLTKLEEIGEWLVDMHGQHDHQILLQQKVHLDILDRHGALSDDREKTSALFGELLKKLEYHRELSQDEEKLQQEKVFWETAVKDIEGGKFQPGEEAELAETIRRMENAEHIARAMTSAYSVLYDDENAVSVGISRALTALRDVAGLDKRYEEIVEMLEDAGTKVSESADRVSDCRDHLEFDQKAMEEAIDRSETIKDLLRKYRKSALPELIEYAAECRGKIERFENRGAELAKLVAEIGEWKQRLVDAALELSRKRQTVAKDLSEKVQRELAFLGMEKARFSVDIKYVKAEDDLFVINKIPVKIGETGMDRVEFLISPNAGEEPRPLRKIASGGEISRVMLALKAIFAKSDAVGTLIFDEIDTGIGGLTANNVGAKMREIAEGRQLIAITHLAQIASRATTHWTVSKETRENRTFTHVKRLESGDRVTEIARMLGGEGEAAMKHARAMLGM
jgi:DNA repair protein RecN (Recombination protein N)